MKAFSEIMMSNLLFLNFLLYFIPSLTQAASCEDISGRWVNQLGSEVDIDHLQSGVLRGKYYTSVSSTGGKLAGHDIFGMLFYNP
jgi:hypothetical protein